MPDQDLNANPGLGKAGTKMPLLWLDAQRLTAFHGTTEPARFGPSLFFWINRPDWTGKNRNTYAGTIGDSGDNLGIVVINATGATLEVDDAMVDTGAFVAEPESALIPPPDELGAPSATVGWWGFDSAGFSGRPGAAIKFKAIPETDNLPVFIACDSGSFWLELTKSVAVRVGGDGTAEDYYTASVATHDAPNWGKEHATDRFVDIQSTQYSDLQQLVVVTIESFIGAG